MTLPKLSNLVNDLCELRAELRKQGASAQELATQTEQLVRHYWQPHVVDERFWPDWATRHVCAYCDGTGLVVHRHITNRLGVTVDEGSPCRCPLGARFTKAPMSEADHAQAGKTPKPTKPWQRVGR
jgi:hypothetical protein